MTLCKYDSMFLLLFGFLKKKTIRSSFKTLQSIVKKRGIHKTGKGNLINLNMKLTSTLTGSIDEEFRETFP